MMTGAIYPQRGKTVEDLPENERVRMVVKVSLITSLIWSYVDAALYTAAQKRQEDTKKLSRDVRALEREYEQFLRFDRETTLKAQELGELFEEVNKAAFRRLYEGLRVEIRRKANLGAEDEYLILVVQMAMTLIDALRRYDADCGAWMGALGVPNHTVIPSHVTRLARLLPQYAKACYDPESQSRKITANILYEQIKNIELYDERGKV